MTRLAESAATAVRPRGPTDEGPYDVFIAYARDDSKPFVVGLVRALEAQGLNVYVDFDDIRAGAEDWRKEIARGIELSHAFAFVVSPLSVQSGECSEELNLATGFGKRIVTILRCHPEDVDIVQLDRRLRAPQWIPFPDGAEFDKCLEILQKALAEDSEWIHKHTELLMLANRWEEGGRKRGQLLHGDSLKEAERWQASRGGAGRHPTKVQGDFIRASRKAVSLRQRGIIGLLTVALLVAIGLLVWAVSAERSATHQRKVAQSRAAAAAALLNLTSPVSNKTDPQLSVLLAEQAMKTEENAQAAGALRQSLAALGGLGKTTQVLGRHRHTGPLRDATFSDDGRFVATASLDGTARLWRTSDGQQVACFRGPARLDSVALSANGRELAAGAENGTISLWRASANAGCVAAAQATEVFAPPTTNPQKNAFSLEFQGNDRILSSHRSGDAYIWRTGDSRPVKHFRASGAALNTAQFSRDGRLIVTAGADGIARVWRVASQRQAAALGRRGPALEMAAFDSSAHQVVTAGDDGTARVWLVAKRDQTSEFEAGEKLYTVAFQPGGEQVLLGGFDRTARLWDPLTGQVTGDFVGHGDAVYRARFDRSGEHVVTASFDKTARIWNLPRQGRELQGARLRSGAFSPDGSWLATASASGDVTLWRAAGPSLAFTVSAPTALNGVRFSDDSKQLAAAGQDGSAYVWTLANRQRVVLPGSEPLRSAAFSADGKRLVTAGHGGVRIWTLGSAPRTDVQLTRRPVDDAAFSPDGKRVVAAGRDRVARIWKLSSPKRPIILRGHLLEVVSAEFDPSGKRVVTASHDGTVKIWSATTGSLAVKLRGHVENANGASFSRPDGRLVVSAGDDDTARLWDASTGGLVSLFSAPGTVMRADIQPGGGKILIVGGDGRARLYNCVACTPDRALLTQAKALVHRRLTPAERKKYP